MSDGHVISIDNPFLGGLMGSLSVPGFEQYLLSSAQHV